MHEQERKVVLDQLNASGERILNLVNGLTADQWTWRPAEGRWSIAECLEHITRVENRVHGLIDSALKEGNSEPEKRLPHDELVARDAELSRAVLDRSVARQAPEPVRPSGNGANGDGLRDEFRQVRERSNQFVSTAQDDLRNYFRPHGAFGEIDCYQWLILISFHGARHAAQIEEIKAAPGFPKANS